MTIEAVIFDIGNVLIEWQPERHYDRVIGEARRRADAYLRGGYGALVGFELAGGAEATLIPEPQSFAGTLPCFHPEMKCFLLHAH